MSYLFGIHDELGNPWDYMATGGVFALQSKHCTAGRDPLTACECCWNCEILAKTSNIQAILQWMENGMHENANLAYHSVGSLMTHEEETG